MKNSTAEKLKQIPAGYLVIGVDPHKKKHAAVAMPQDFRIRSKFKFANSRRGYDQMLEWARSEIVLRGTKSRSNLVSCRGRAYPCPGGQPQGLPLPPHRDCFAALAMTQDPSRRTDKDETDT